jgi:hypothetical protein
MARTIEESIPGECYVIIVTCLVVVHVQVTAEQHCQALQAELDSLRQEYDAFRIAAFNEKAQLSEDRKHAIGDMSKHRDAAESMQEKYEEAKARLDKERDVAFDLAADLRAQLNAAKARRTLATCSNPITSIAKKGAADQNLTVSYFYRGLYLVGKRLFHQ